MAQPLSNATSTFGQRIRSRRRELDWTQEQLAEAAGLHWTYIGQVERGERNISLRNMTRIAAATTTDLGELTAGLAAW